MPEALHARALAVTLGGRAVLSVPELTVQHGEVLAVLGPNGAGKSTLLRALAGLVRHTGELRVDGRELSRLDVRTRAHCVSFVPQHSQLTTALSVREVVALGRYVHRGALARPTPNDMRAIDEALAEMDVEALSGRAFPDLSTGEQKRVLIARALCTGARILLLDEPSASLDIEHALRLFALLKGLAARGHAVVLVLHQLEHALTLADRALLVRRGCVLAAGPTRDVITPERVRALYGVELVPNAAPAFRLPPEPT